MSKPLDDVTATKTKKGEWEIMVGDFYVCTITADGELSLHGCLPDDIGLQLDDRGRIRLKVAEKPDEKPALEQELLERLVSANTELEAVAKYCADVKGADSVNAAVGFVISRNAALIAKAKGQANV